MAEMTISEALAHVQRIAQSGQRQDGAPFHLREGQVTVYVGALEMGLQHCPYCNSATSTGTITVTHDDGRQCSFDSALYHYARAGHPISEELAENLIAIMSDM